MHLVISLLYLIRRLLHVSAPTCHLHGASHLVSYLKAEMFMLFVIYCEWWWPVCTGCCGSVCCCPAVACVHWLLWFCVLLSSCGLCALVVVVLRVMLSSCGLCALVVVVLCVTHSEYMTNSINISAFK
jgi:hypothetical protein